MAEHKPQTGSRKSKSLFEIYEKRRRGEKERSQTKVILGAAFPRWRALKAQRGLRSDALVATFLLDSYDKVSSTPVPHTPGVCTVCQGSLSARDDKSSVAEIEEVLDDTSQQLDPSAESEEADSNTEAVSEEDGSDESQCETSSEKDDRPSPHVQTGDAPKRRKHREGVKNSRLPSTSSEESAGHQSDVLGDSSPPEQPPQPSRQPIDLRLSPEPSPTDTAAAEAEGETEQKSSGTEDSSDDEPDQNQDNCSTTTELFPQKDVESDSPSRAKSYDCLTCGKVFSNSSALRRHLVIHTGKRPHKCFICGRGFTQSGNLKTHMKVHKGEVPNWALIQEKPAPREPHVRAHVCSDCGMDFPNLEQLVEHRDTHKKPYACPDCGKAFKVEAYFKQHTLMHTGGLAFPCSECGKPWATLDLLRKHEQCHSTERSFHCDQCGKAFSKAASLKVHLKTHTGERTYLCSVCGKSYSKAHPLKVHLRVHTGEKPYICHTCGKGFYYLQGYQKHILIHNKKPKPRSKPLGRPKQLLLLTDA